MAALRSVLPDAYQGDMHSALVAFTDTRELFGSEAASWPQ